MGLPAGALREKITIEHPEKVQRPDGGFDTVYTEILATYARVVEITPSAEVVASQENLYNLVQFTMRHRQDVYIVIGDRITWRGFIFTVASSMKVDPLRTRIDIMAQSEFETTER